MADDIRRRRVLIVEDEALIAMEMEWRVQSLGYDVIGPASTIAAAAKLLDETTPDAAILDVNLAGEPVTPIARRVREAGIPFALTTGYARLALDDPAFQGVPTLSKPVADRDLVRALNQLLGEAK